MQAFCLYYMQMFMYTVIIMLYVCTCTVRVLHCRLTLSSKRVHVVSKSDISEPSHIMSLRDTTTKYVILLT